MPLFTIHNSSMPRLSTTSIRDMVLRPRNNRQRRTGKAKPVPQSRFVESFEDIQDTTLDDIYFNDTSGEIDISIIRPSKPWLECEAPSSASSFTSSSTSMSDSCSRSSTLFSRSEPSTAATTPSSVKANPFEPSAPMKMECPKSPTSQMDGHCLFDTIEITDDPIHDRLRPILGCCEESRTRSVRWAESVKLERSPSLPLIQIMSPKLYEPIGDLESDPQIEEGFPNWYIQAYKANELEECRHAAAALPPVSPRPCLRLCRRPLTFTDRMKEIIWHQEIQKDWEVQDRRRQELEQGVFEYWGGEADSFKTVSLELRDLYREEFNPPMPPPMIPQLPLLAGTPLNAPHPPLPNASRPLTYQDHLLEKRWHEELQYKREMHKLSLCLQKRLSSSASNGILYNIFLCFLTLIAFCFMSVT